MKLILSDGTDIDFENFTFDSRTGFLELLGEYTVPDDEEEPGADPDPEIPDNVEHRYDFDIMGEAQKKVTIPASDILSSRFRAPFASEKRNGKISFQIPTGEPTPMTMYWVSETPGGVPISEDAVKVANYIYNISWVVGQDARGRLRLEEGRAYYLNMQHYPGRNKPSVADRFVK